MIKPLPPTTIFLLERTKEKTSLLLFILLFVYSIGSIKAQGFDDLSASNIKTSNVSLAPTSAIVKGRLFAYHYRKLDKQKETTKEKLVINLSVRNLRTQ